MAHTGRATHKDSHAEPRPATKQIGIRLPVRLTDRLEAIARAESNQLSSVVRRLLTAALNSGDEAA
jgi:predicted DNA-binding protein